MREEKAALIVLILATVAVLLAALAGAWSIAPPWAPSAQAVNERPPVNIPPQLRQSNWQGSKGEGSCVWASTIPLLRWQNRITAADYIRRTYGDGEYPQDWAAKMGRAKLRYAYTTSGDVKFLERAIRTRRGAGVVVQGGSHMVNLLGLDAKSACLLDNNSIGRFLWVPRQTFLYEWRASGGWALAVVYDPVPPLPRSR